MPAIKSIFLLEDDRDDQALFKDALEKVSANFILSVASNGAEALNQLSSSILKPDLIFSDINMPLMDGFQFVHAIKKHENLREIPIVMLSTFVNEVNKKLAHKLGVKQMLQKPDDFVHLCEILNRVIRMELADADL